MGSRVKVIGMVTHDVGVGPSCPVQMHLIARCHSGINGRWLTSDDASVRVAVALDVDEAQVCDWALGIKTSMVRPSLQGARPESGENECLPLPGMARMIRSGTGS